MSADPILSRMADKLHRRSPLDSSDRAAILSLPYSERTINAPAYIIREGEQVRNFCSYIISGFAFRQKLTAEGGRQIVSVQMAGDFLDLQQMFLDLADHNVQALTRMDVADVARDALQTLILDRPAVGRAMWIDGLIEASIHREWVLNVGRRDARARIAHVLCEFAVRMKAAGIAEGDGYKLPMTQEQLGDAVGLTSVHVNRTLRALVNAGLVQFDRRNLKIVDWDGIREVGDFSPLYLHLDQTEMSPA